MRPIVNVPEENRATDIGNKHKKLETIARVVPEISTRTERQTYSSQYIATAKTNVPYWHLNGLFTA